ncbi:colipase-like isoform X2 [Heterodontus francisci]|uniref:colipase-like isoform X2 n=1 Tax=Heterodontus francisci TaxID=7792 RepID=UPI00355BBE17
MKLTLVFLACCIAMSIAVPERGLLLNLLLYNVYYKCPCENGLKCDGDKTIIGSIMNTDFGICKDPNRIAKVIKANKVPIN